MKTTVKIFKQEQNTHLSTQCIIYIMKHIGVSTNRSIHADAVHIETHKKRDIFVENIKELGWEM